jgi:hypothetical protein
MNSVEKALLVTCAKIMEGQMAQVIANHHAKGLVNKSLEADHNSLKVALRHWRLAHEEDERQRKKVEEERLEEQRLEQSLEAEETK